jgi:hypothetical protein
MKQGLGLEPTPVEGVGEGASRLKLMPGVELDTTSHVLRITYPIEYKNLLLLVARGLRNLTIYNRGNTTYLRSTKILRSAFFDEYGLLKVRTLPIVLSQVTYILHKLRDVGLIDKMDGAYVLSRASQLWDVAKHSTPQELAEFLLEVIMTTEG